MKILLITNEEIKVTMSSSLKHSKITRKIEQQQRKEKRNKQLHIGIRFLLLKQIFELIRISLGYIQWILILKGIDRSASYRGQIQAIVIKIGGTFLMNQPGNGFSKEVYGMLTIV